MYFEHHRRGLFEGCVADPLQAITAFLPSSKWLGLLLRIVVQDAMCEVPRRATVVSELNSVIQEEKLKLSLTEGGREGKQKLIVPDMFLELRMFWDV